MQRTAVVSGANVSPVSLQQRIVREELFRKRRAADHQRFVETFRRSAVDPNPHQVQAVAFALSRLETGGVLLCDEVGLGKTIETGLLLTQLRAEGRFKVLIIVPVSLKRQWQAELRDLFGIPSKMLAREKMEEPHEPGVYIVGREFAGTPRWATELNERGPWDLFVVDEAHELLSSIHRRFNGRTGEYQADLSKGDSRRAGVLRELTAGAPTVLLTATPLQNSLYELWSLIHFANRENTILGDFHQFAQLFCRESGRGIKPEMGEELRRRLDSVVYRTLRADAQPFLREPFTARRCETANFRLNDEERRLYSELSDWLSGPLAAFKRKSKKLMTQLLRRRMGSSMFALASTLSLVRQRLESGPTKEDLENEEEFDMALWERDIEILRGLEQLARTALKKPSAKLKKLWEMLEKVRQGALGGVHSDKVVIFTESTKTLYRLKKFLEEQGLEGQVTSFSGSNTSPAAKKALARWEKEVGCHLEPSQHPEKSSAIRAALIHEFKTRTRILISTESGAKGLNLQFCNCLINFDLPWNPQRIEQRIGRIHRYGQKHDAVIINFINLDNEAEKRVYELLTKKLNLFQGLFGASDEILGAVVSALDLERRVNDLLDACHTPEERQREFDRLGLEIDAETKKLRDRELKNARDIISSLDRDVQARLKLIADELPTALSHRDELLLDLLEAESPVRRLGKDGSRLIFEWAGRRYHLGPPDPSPECGEPIDLDHPLIEKRLSSSLLVPEGKSWNIQGAETREWQVYRVSLRGLEEEEQLLVLGEGGKGALTEALRLASGLHQQVDEPWPEAGLSQCLNSIRTAFEQKQAPRVAQLQQHLDNRQQDLDKFLELRLRELETKLKDAEKARREARNPEDARKTKDRHDRYRRALESFRRDSEARRREVSRQVSREKQSLAKRRLVDVKATPLFRVQVVPK